jgi:transcriptional regulator with XRE-family HTH domain
MINDHGIDDDGFDWAGQERFDRAKELEEDARDDDRDHALRLKAELDAVLEDRPDLYDEMRDERPARDPGRLHPLHYARWCAQLTQKELAQKAGLNHADIGRIESGWEPPADVAARLAAVLRLPAEHLGPLAWTPAPADVRQRLVMVQGNAHVTITELEAHSGICASTLTQFRNGKQFPSRLQLEALAGTFAEHATHDSETQQAIFDFLLEGRLPS